MKPHRIRALVGFVSVVIVVATLNGALAQSTVGFIRGQVSDAEPIRTATAPSSFV